MLLLCLIWANLAAAGGDEEAQQLGWQVRAAGAMRAITDLGTDSRYYTMVRGWLHEQLKGDRSIVAAAGAGVKPRLEARIRFLEKAIRAIDLE